MGTGNSNTRRDALMTSVFFRALKNAGLRNTRMKLYMPWFFVNGENRMPFEKSKSLNASSTPYIG